MHRFTAFFCSLIVISPLVSPSAWGQPASGGEALLIDLDGLTLYPYGTWKDRVREAGGRLIVRGEGVTNRGGATVVHRVDLASYAERTIAMRLRLGKANRAADLRIHLRDKEGRHGAWVFPIGELPHGEWIDVVAQGGAPLGAPTMLDESKGRPDLAQLSGFQLQSGWEGPNTLNVVVDRIALITEKEAAMLAADKPRLDALKLRQALAEAEHTPDSPRITHVGAVATDLLELVVQEGRIEQQSQEPYEAQPGDEVRGSDHEPLGWENGELKNVPKKRELLRTVDGSKKRIGMLAGGANGPPLLLRDEVLLGEPLNLMLADLPEAYALRSADDPAFSEPVRPTAVYRKSRPNEKAMPDVGYAVLHRLYLRFPTPLREGAQYELSLAGVNTSEARRAYVHDTKANRSSAIHTNQAGYRPDDPHKRAYLSLWTGTGGGESYDDATRFEVLNAAGETVHSGDVVRVLDADGVETMRTNKNHHKSAVYAMDFTPVAEPGKYVVRVPGIGVSYPVRVAEDAWRRAFRASMHGFLTQRSGVELGPPVTSYRRPRPLHPDGQPPVFRSETDETDAVSRQGQTWFEALVEGRTDREEAGAWGGYHDAADYDRRGDHLWASYQHVELLDLFPEVFERLRLRLPGDESIDELPDVLNEALWNVECFERIQREDGGVGGGIEASDHPRIGETSWTDSLAWMTYAPDVYNSYTYAAVAARTARVASRYDADRGERIGASALRAWEWAERHASEVQGDKQLRRARDSRAAAAVALLELTKEPRFDEAYAESNNLDGTVSRTQHGSAFAYARLPEGLGQADLKRRARERVLQRADRALQYGDGNAFGLTSIDQNMPLIGPVGAFSTPGMGSLSLPRAHYLTADVRYLAGAVRACEFPLGANPANTVMTTGIGFEPVKNPLHFDSRYSGQPAPAGITVYGPYDPDSLPGYTAGQEWGHRFILAGRTTPPSRTWPTSESHADIFLWPMLTEFTVWQNMAPTSYYWGYLAARAELGM